MSKKSFLFKKKDAKKDDHNQDEEKDVFDQIEQDQKVEDLSDDTSCNQDDNNDEYDDEEEVEESGEEEGEQWLEESGEEGQLAVDVYQNGNNIVIKSTIAGVSPEDIDVNINNDMVTIKGSRQTEHEISEDDYFYQECYWGSFSRSIVLPQEVEAEHAQASMKNGVLTLVLPKAAPKKPVEIKVKKD